MQGLEFGFIRSVSTDWLLKKDDMKKCSRCKKVQPKENFSRMTNNKDGLNGHCKDCCRVYSEARKQRKNESFKCY